MPFFQKLITPGLYLCIRIFSQFINRLIPRNAPPVRICNYAVIF